jgi:hypothetical protein
MNSHPLPGSPDELDRRFGAYFKAQVPQPWPTAPVANVEASARVPAVQRESPTGRVTLAASVACLLGLGLALSYGPGFQSPAAPSGGLLKNGSADGKDLQKHMDPEHQPKLPTP